MPQPDRGIAEVMIRLVERDLESGTAKQDEWLPDEEQLRLAGHTLGEFGTPFFGATSSLSCVFRPMRFLNRTSSRSRPN
jgi:hypothetical protein